MDNSGIMLRVITYKSSDTDSLTENITEEHNTINGALSFSKGNLDHSKQELGHGIGSYCTVKIE